MHPKTKSDVPPFKMVIENGRMLPATPYDQERLMTWRNGTRVSVEIVRDSSRVGVRKWWAVLGRAVKDGNTPWDNQIAASEAIKQALDLVHVARTHSGTWFTYPQSLNELDDAELDLAVVRMMDLLYEITGIDPAEWRKEAAAVEAPDDDNPNPSASPPPEAEDAATSDTAVSSPAEGVADGAGGVSSPAGATEQQQPPPPGGSQPPVPPKLTEDERDFLIEMHRVLIGAVGPDQKVLDRQAAGYKEKVGAQPVHVREKARLMFTELSKLCGDPANDTPAKRRTAVKYIAGIFGTDERRLAT